MAQSIQPLRINKNTPTSSPGKMTGQPVQRPLAEVGPMERRRNSPSYNQNTKKNFFYADSSPYEPSSLSSNSPKQYWQKRTSGSPNRLNTENRNPLEEHDHASSVIKRSSIENLKRASRVKNSSMFAREHKQEYDPASSPLVERPLASGRPLGNATDGKAGLNQSPLKSPARMRDFFEATASPTKLTSSPTKSSMSSKSRYTQDQAFDPESSIWSDEGDSIAERQLPPGKSLHRHAKSVTFDVAPPQINEYEMTTPDPSSVASGSRDGSHDSDEDDEEEESFDRGSSIDREDSFDASLEDTEKTPVVLPEDWRFMSPGAANDDLAAKIDDPFDLEARSPSPTIKPFSAIDARSTPTRTDFGTSDGEKRPLPPLPPAIAPPTSSRERADSSPRLSATVERAMQNPRKDASPPRPASVSKAELQGMGGSSMPLEERLRLMMIQESEGSRSAADEQRERRLRRGSPNRDSNAPGHYQSSDHGERQEVPIEESEIGDFEVAPRISRESILRKVKDRNHQARTLDEPFSPDSALEFDPDVPLPSTETDGNNDDVQIKQEFSGDESDLDVYAIPDLYNRHLEAESFMNAIEKLEAVQQSRAADEMKDQDDESHYSEDLKGTFEVTQKIRSPTDDEGPPTPRANESIKGKVRSENENEERMSLPQFASFLSDQDFGLGMESFLTPSPGLEHDPMKQLHTTADPFTAGFTQTYRESEFENKEHPSASPKRSFERPATPVEQLQPPHFPLNGPEIDACGTPDSVIRRSIEDEPAMESPVVPEPVATIKSSGSRLKTRPSATPADIQTMAETRRQVSGESTRSSQAHPKHMSRPSVVAEGDETNESVPATLAIGHESIHDGLKQPKRKSSLIPLDVPVEGSAGLGFGIESEFDRVIEAQKKGYLMRQNTKVIVASSASHESNGTEAEQPQDANAREIRSAGNSPRKPSHTKTWTTEPWNGRIRRKSIRHSGGIPSKSMPSGPAPPLPGQESNVSSGLGSVNEDEALPGIEEVGEDGERGRLFVKVVRVKDLDLPLPKSERSYFALTLDNGMHCVTTSWLELGKTAPIGQEFELIVLNDLEFQLTLQTKLEEPKAKPAVESPTKATRTSKTSTFSKVFSSPRKRKELELKQQEEAQRAERQRQQDAQASRKAAQPTAWDLLHKLVAKDGTFARSYICLKDHESSAYGRAVTVDVPCFNEWATEESTTNSYKSKRSGVDMGVQRKAPYRIGKLELQLFYVPKPKDAKDEDMPKSMNACIRELKEAESASPTQWEGHLSQQGGDCPYWRRRFFTLNGAKLTAYHEATRQPRATINLAKASKLIDDKSSLMRNDVSPKKGGRRKSAFAEEEEGYMFVEEGFRIRFANGEIIDFYADKASEKDDWMIALGEVVGKDVNKAKSWTDVVLAKKGATGTRAKRDDMSNPQQQQPRPQSSAKQAPIPPSAKSAPPTPAKTFAPRAAAPVPPKSPRRSDVTQKRTDPAKTRSLVF